MRTKPIAKKVFYSLIGITVALSAIFTPFYIKGNHSLSFIFGMSASLALLATAIVASTAQIVDFKLK